MFLLAFLVSIYKRNLPGLGSSAKELTEVSDQSNSRQYWGSETSPHCAIKIYV